MALKFYEKYQITNLIEHLKVIYPNELEDSMIESLKKNILESKEDFSSLAEEIRNLFEYDTNKLQVFLIKNHVTIKGNLEIPFLKKKESFLKKISSLVDTGIQITMISAAIAVVLYSGFRLNRSFGNPIGKAFTIVPTSASMEEFIEKSVNENRNLEEEERKFFEKYATYLEENPYAEKIDTYYSLKDLKIDYVESEEAARIKRGAQYFSGSNQIVAYNFQDNDDFINRIQLGHEGFHALSGEGENCGFMKVDLATLKMSSLGQAMTEGMTQILTEEYLVERASGITYYYPEETCLVKIIAELVGADTLLYGYSNHDIDIVIKKLGELDGNVDKARNLIELMDKMTRQQHLNKEVQQECKNQIYPILQEYYQLKVAENPEKAQILTYLIEAFYHDVKAGDSPVYCYELHKAYFSEELKSRVNPYLIYRNQLYNFDDIKEDLPSELNYPLIMLQNDMPIGELANAKIQK